LSFELAHQRKYDGSHSGTYLVLVNLIWGLWVAKGFLFHFSAEAPAPSDHRRGTVFAICLFQIGTSCFSQREDFFAYDLDAPDAHIAPTRCPV